MAKKKKKKVIVKKKKVSKKKSRKKAPKRKSSINTQKVEIQMQPILVDNFVALQKVMVNLAAKFDNLNTQLSKLLELFELSAKSLAKKGFKLEGSSESAENNKAVLNKLGELSEQNKILARGMTLMHEQASVPEPMPALPVIPKPATPFPTSLAPPTLKPLPKAPEAGGEYKKSAPSKPEKAVTTPAKK